MPTSQPATFEQRSFGSGMNAATLPTQALRADEVSLLVNATVKNGFISTRPGWHWQPLNFVGVDAQRIFENGKYQGSDGFMAGFGSFLTYCVDGHLFSYNPKNGNVTKVTGASPAFSPQSEHVWIKQRNKWIVAQDGVSPPFVSDGFTNTQEVVEEGIPTGTFMADGWHRFFVVSPDRTKIYASDHEMDPLTTPISFTEATLYFANARYFEAPPSLGRITGIAFTPFQDTSTGIGPLLVFMERGTRAYNISVPRSDWVTGDISQTIMPHVGAGSFFAFTDMGSQLVFRDQDGRIRTIRNAQQVEASGSFVANDFSIVPILADEDTTLREYSQAVTFDGRVMILTHGERIHMTDQTHVVAHKGIAVMEVESVSDKTDVWTFWTGLNICGMDVLNVDGEEVCVAFARGDDGKNRLYHLVRDSKQDVVYDKDAGLKECDITMTIATVPLDFGSSTTYKQFSGGGIRLTNMRGVVQVNATWESDGRPPEQWFNHIETHAKCMTFGKTITSYASGANPRLVFPKLPATQSTFYQGRAIFEITGPATVESIAMAVEIKQQSTVNTTKCNPKGGNPQPQKAVCGVDIFKYKAK